MAAVKETEETERPEKRPSQLGVVGLGSRGHETCDVLKALRWYTSVLHLPSASPAWSWFRRVQRPEQKKSSWVKITKNGLWEWKRQTLLSDWSSWSRENVENVKRFGHWRNAHSALLDLQIASLPRPFPQPRSVLSHNPTLKDGALQILIQSLRHPMSSS